MTTSANGRQERYDHVAPSMPRPERPKHRANESAKVMTGTVEVQGSGSNRYRVEFFDDGSAFCSCPSWKFQKTPAKTRTCKHIDRVRAASQAA